MSPASPEQSGTITLNAAIDRYFQVALYLLVLTGFGTLAATGAIDAATVLLVGMALFVRGYFLSKRSDIQIPTRWTNLLTIIYVGFYIADFALLSRSFLTATVHLVLFGMVIRLFSAQKERDHYMLAVLSFLMVLAGSVLTVDSVFLFSFAAFMLMAVTTFVLMEMRRSSVTATIPARESTDPWIHRRMAFFLAGSSPVLVLMILAGAFGIFFLLPRTTTAYLGSYASGNNLSVGFSDRVRLGRIGQIQQSNAVVMHVEIAGDTHGSHDLKWRGVALGVFDGRVWSNTSEQTILSRQSDTRFAIPQADHGVRARSLQPIHYRVLMEPIGTNIFFLAARPRFLTGSYRTLAVDRGDAVYDLDFEHPPSVYEADSDLATPSEDKLQNAGDSVPPEIQLNYLQLPGLDRRIPALAQQITASASNNYDRATLIAHYLTKTFGYTLELPRNMPQDPLADFLFVRKRGHCEYFASSMAIMLRTLRIPSRVVNGFRTTEFNDLTSNYVIRASSAHSWVEAFFPGYGWVSFDPTPASPPLENSGWNRMLLYIDAAASFWREWVVDYDSNHQKALGEDAMRTSRSLVDRVRDWSQQRYAALLEKARHTQKKVTDSPRKWGFISFVLIVLLALGSNARTLLRWVHERKLKSHPESAPTLAAALWYQRVVRWLGRRGWKKTSAQTPKEFLTRIEDPAMRARVEVFTRAYEAARFGDSAEEAKRLPVLFEEITTAGSADRKS